MRTQYPRKYISGEIGFSDDNEVTGTDTMNMYKQCIQDMTGIWYNCIYNKGTCPG